MGMDLCTSNFRNYHSLKDSPARVLLPFLDRAALCGQVQTGVSHFRHLTGSAPETFARGCHLRPRPSWVSFSLRIPRDPTPSGRIQSSCRQHWAHVLDRYPSKHRVWEPLASQG